MNNKIKLNICALALAFVATSEQVSATNYACQASQFCTVENEACNAEAVRPIWLSLNEEERSISMTDTNGNESSVYSFLSENPTGTHYTMTNEEAAGLLSLSDDGNLLMSIHLLGFTGLPYYQFTIGGICEVKE